MYSTFLSVPLPALVYILTSLTTSILHRKFTEKVRRVIDLIFLFVSSVVEQKCKMPGVSIFKDVPLVPTDHVFHVNQQYKDDKNPNKVNLGIGGKVSLYFCGKWVSNSDRHAFDHLIRCRVPVMESSFTVVY